MLDLAVIAARLLQYGGAMVLLGSSLFFVYAVPGSSVRGARRLVAGAAALLALSSLAGIAAQASLFAGTFADGLTGEAMGAVAGSMDLGKAAVVRAIAAAAALVALLVFPPGRTGWLVAAGLGAVATASLAWMGHGAATAGSLGSIHLVSDAVHGLAAAVWLGALASFAVLLANPLRADPAALHTALRRFSGVGSIVVALLVLTGLINGWVLVGPDHAGELLASPYGRLLALKLVLFGAMLALAAANRFRLTPALGAAAGPAAVNNALGALRRSVALETAAGVVVLGLVAWLGTLAPPA